MDQGSQEFWTHIHMPDPCVCVFYPKNVRGEIVALHSHQFYEVIFVLSGRLNYLLDGKRFRLQPGDIVLVPPGMGHRPLFLEELTEPYERLVVWLDQEFWRASVAETPFLNYVFEQCAQRENYLLRTSGPTWNGLRAGALALYQEVEQRRPGWECCVRHAALVLMVHVCRTFYYWNVAVPVAETELLADRIFSYIDTHLTEKLTLGGVAEHFLISQSTLSHLFQKQFGVSFYRCVVQRRLIAAKNAMFDGVRLQEVWECCGFADYSSFYRAFKKEYGCSPNAFKSQSRKKI